MWELEQQVINIKRIDERAFLKSAATFVCWPFYAQLQSQTVSAFYWSMPEITKQFYCCLKLVGFHLNCISIWTAKMAKYFSSQMWNSSFIILQKLVITSWKENIAERVMKMQILSFAACRIDNWKCALLLGFMMCVYTFIQNHQQLYVYRHRFSRNVSQLHKHNSMLCWNLKYFFFAFFIILSLLFVFCFSFSLNHESDIKITLWRLFHL